MPDETEPSLGGAKSPMSNRTKWLSWLFGLALLATVALVASQRAEERELARLLERAKPQWLLVAFALQGGTYFAEAGVWHRVLARSGAGRPLFALVGLALAKLFMDQAVPSGGISGTLLVVKALDRRGVPRETSMAGVVVDLSSYYVAYASALAAALALVFWRQVLGVAVLVPAVLFMGVAVTVPFLLRALVRRGPRPLGRIGKIPLVAPLLRAIAGANGRLVTDAVLLASCVGLQLAIVGLDTLTLWLTFEAIGAPAPLAAVFTGFAFASLARTLGIVPGGLGTFEAASVAALHLLGIPVGAALAATLLFRGLSFWLPLVPGLVLARFETREARATS